MMRHFIYHNGSDQPFHIYPTQNVPCNLHKKPLLLVKVKLAHEGIYNVYS